MARGKKTEANLEDMIRAAAANGELTYISLAPTAGKGPGGIGWSACYSPASKWGHGFGRHESDPVEAIKLAMTDDRLGSLVKGLHKTLTKAATPNAAKAAEGLGLANDADLLPDERDPLDP